MKYKIYNEDCNKTIERENVKFNVVLTSPPYNTSRKGMSKRAVDNYECRYDSYQDFKGIDEYIDWSINIFKKLESKLGKDGVILYNMSYSSENIEKASMMYGVIGKLLTDTNLCVADTIIWKKKSALPNNVSKNKLTRICEFVFVIVRKKEFKSFQANKEVSKVSEKNNQKYYKNYFNFIEAPNNDGSCKLNKATYSSELCNNLLSLYAKEGDII